MDLMVLPQIFTKTGRGRIICGQNYPAKAINFL